MINVNSLRVGYDATTELDKFSQPRLRTETELIKNTVLFILFSKPGQYPSLPNIGMNIQNILLSHYDDISESDIRDRLINQCSVMGMYFDNGTIIIRKIKYRGKPSLMIHIESTSDDMAIQDVLTDANQNNAQRFQIGITFDELDQIIHNVSEGRD